tara:strand:+ start:581 stop:847 length:267 start_codon:yes stop_codon:yes gene_type:complete
MAKEKINEYIHGIKSTSYLLDIDENNNSFKRVCIFFNHPITNGEIEMHLNKNDSAEMLIEENNEVFINTENVDARIEQEKEMFKEFNE